MAAAAFAGRSPQSIGDQSIPDELIAWRDLAKLVALRRRVEDAEMALSKPRDEHTPLEGYAMLEVMGKGSGLETRRGVTPSAFSFQRTPPHLIWSF